MERFTRRTYLLVAATALAAIPMLVLGARTLVAEGPTGLFVGAVVVAAISFLAARPIRLAPHSDLSLAAVPVLGAAFVLPLLAIAPVAALAQLLSGLLARRSARALAGDVLAGVVSAGTASLSYRAATDALTLAGGPAPSVATAAIAACAYAAVRVVQSVALAESLRPVPGGSSGPLWQWPIFRTQVIWAVGSAMLVEAGRIQPLFLLPGVPLLVLGYQNIRRRFIAERRVRVLTTLVDVSHALGSSLDLTTIYRAAYAKIHGSLEADAFFVVLGTPTSEELSYRYLVDEGRELEPQELPRRGTLAGKCITEGRALLMTDALRDYHTLGLERTGWGTVTERSIMVAPLRIRGDVIGAISVQSVNPGAYDEGDLELLGAMANEAAIAIERSELYEETADLSRRLVELHRVGLEISSERDLHAAAERLSSAAREVVGSSAVAVYLDDGTDSYRFEARSGPSKIEVARLPKSMALTKQAVESGVVEVPDSAAVNEESRRMLEASGHRAVLIYPLRAASEPVGIAYVTWTEPHAVTKDERELLDILMNMGATALRSLRLYSELDDAYLATVQTLMTTIQARDGYREDHQQRVATDAVAFGERLGLPEDRLRDLRYASLFHSLGKIGVPPSILAKPGPLSDEERRIVREHPILGARIIESIRFLRNVVPIVRHANERWDGTGYPDGLAGDAIPREARLLQIVLTYHAMLADRPYRRGLDPRTALGELRLLAGTRYDPALVEQFVALIEERGGVEAAQREVQEGTRELAILAEITPQFNTLLDLPQLLAQVLKSLERHWPEAQLHILLRDEQTEDLVVRAVGGPESALRTGVRLARGMGLSSWVLANREPVVVEDVDQDPRARPQEGMRGAVMVPLINEGRAIGVLSLTSGRAGAFSPRDLTLLQAVGAQIAAAIEVAALHERLKRAASTDGLTGLHNHRYFYDRLEEEIARAARRATPLAVAYFDIDGLKRVNDGHGHLAGDAVLRELGRAIGQHVRVEDVPARYGGDEFAIVMPETGRDEAEKVVRRLMDLVDATRIDLGDGTSIPMPERSWGVASHPQDGATAKELVENADTRAYARKRAKA